MTESNDPSGSRGRGNPDPDGIPDRRNDRADVPPESDVFAHGAGVGWGAAGTDPTPTQSMAPVGPEAAGARASQQVGAPPYTTTTGPRRRGMTGIVIGFLVVVIIAALSVVLLGFTVLGWGRTGDSRETQQPETPAVVETTVVTVTDGPTEESAATTTSEKSTSSEPKTGEKTTTESTKASTTKKKPVFSVPDEASNCGTSGGFVVYAGTDVTSCGFAMNVGGQIAGQGGNSSRTITAVSPVTGRSYRMTCSPKGAGAWVCRGGDNAVVYVAP
ncbi:hypothetical protein M0E87_08475 [Corynebacterium sp. CCM 9185]|uniref:Serine/threonine protein kinase n=1 Tax=Corynebacterium marambiense TaxID=2765364 RepID=A0ABS0VU88_9CORY|nr:hypothetical protein [Corynebacterium marambiense]MBI9000337.1 hypothetical protein [Corynebacterium marambiense]MCK7663690.1 hypothetical protein [Corynebacterium marambiense]MCX7541875.1 hypothetical protein [Corynebacterium marambiense]